MRVPSGASGGARAVQGRSALAVLLLFGLLCAVFFWQLWTPAVGDRRMIGAADGDFVRQFYPYRVFVARAWAAGHPPVWNPHQYGGTPAWADPQQAVLYPWRALQAPFGIGGGRLPLWAVELEAVAHLMLGGWFVALLVRRLSARWTAAAGAGAVFAFGGYLSGYPVEQLAIVDTAIWIAPCLVGVTAMLDAAAAGDRSGARRGAVLAGLATALSGLAGHPQTAVYGLYLALAWFVVRARQSGGPIGRSARLGLAWLALGAGLSAAQWLPSVWLLAQSDRAVSIEDLTTGLRWRDLATIAAAPRARSGDPGVAPDSAAAIVWAPLFVGGIALALTGWGATRDRRALFWAAAALVGLVLSMGDESPIFAPIARWLPGIALFRHPERIAVVFALGMSVAAGIGLDRLLHHPPDVRSLGRACLALAGGAALAAAWLVLSGRAAAVVWSDGLVLAALALLAGGILLAAVAGGRVAPRALGPGLLLLLLLELFSANRGRALTTYRDEFAPDPIVAALVPRARDGRVSSEALLPGGANAASVFGLYDVTGDVALLPATVGRLEQLPEMVRWRLMDVRYVVSERTFEPGAPVREVLRDGQRALYEVQLELAPAWVPDHWSGEWTPSWRPEPAFDPLGEAVVPPDWSSSGSRPLATSSGSARLVRMDPGRATVEARIATPGFLVWSTQGGGWYLLDGLLDASGWSHRVEPGAAAGIEPGAGSSARAADGSPDAAVGGLQPGLGSIPMFGDVTAYGMLPAVALPEGDWAVTWTYVPPGLHFGLALSSAAWILGAFLWRRPRPPKP